MSRSFQPDWVTMVVNMPGISGFEATPQSIAINPLVRVVRLTASIQERSRQMAASLNLSFVAKPATEASQQQTLGYLLAGCP